MLFFLHTLGFISPGGSEMLVIMLALLMLFGAKDAPKILRKFYDFTAYLRRMADEFKHELMYSDLEPEEPPEPAEPPLLPPSDPENPSNDEEEPDV
jgi:Sec-independent protein translocase protein TatA